MAMEKIRLILIILHTLIGVIVVYRLHPYQTLTDHSSTHKKHVSSVIGLFNELLCTTLYHSASILAIAYSRRYGAGMIRATGLLIIGELFQFLTAVTQHVVEEHHVVAVEVIFDVIIVWTFFGAIALTFLLAREVAQRQKDLMQVELLATATDESAMDGRGNFSLV